MMMAELAIQSLNFNIALTWLEDEEIFLDY